jgi:hypothetical protein
MPKEPKKSSHPRAPRSAPASHVHLTKDELQRVGSVTSNIRNSQTQKTVDVHSTFELMYLRVLSRIHNRGPLEKDLKELKTLLDKSAEKMTEILAKAEPVAKAPQSPK